MDRELDGLGQRDQPAIRGILDGQDRPKTEHRHSRSAVHRLVATDAVRVRHLGPVSGPLVGRPGQGHVVHGGPSVAGRDRRREHPRGAEQRVHHTAERRFPVRGDHRPVRVVPDVERSVGRGAGDVLGHVLMGAGIAVLSVAERLQGGRVQVPALVQEHKRRDRRASVDGDQRQKGHGEQGNVPRAVHQPEKLQGPHDRGDRVHRAAGGRHQQHTGVLVADAARTRPDYRQVPVHNHIRLGDGGDQFRRAGPRRQGGPKTAVDHLRVVAGLDHVRLRAVLLPAASAHRRHRDNVAAVRVSHRVLHHVRHRSRIHTGGVLGRDVPGERPCSLFGHRVHHVGILLFLVQQDFPDSL